MQISTQHLTRQ